MRGMTITMSPDMTSADGFQSYGADVNLIIGLLQSLLGRA
jgi:hypothetical protein